MHQKEGHQKEGTRRKGKHQKEGKSRVHKKEGKSRVHQKEVGTRRKWARARYSLAKFSAQAFRLKNRFMKRSLSWYTQRTW